MTTQTLHKTDNSLNIATALQNVLEQSYALYQATHYYHWNVEGARFVALHTLFEEHYTEIFAALDDLAERIRAVGAYVAPIQTDVRIPQIHDDGQADQRATQMVSHLIELHEAVVTAADAAKEVAALADDSVSEDMLIGRITVHQKALWMLRSIIK